MKKYDIDTFLDDSGTAWDMQQHLNSNPNGGKISPVEKNMAQYYIDQFITLRCVLAGKSRNVTICSLPISGG